MITDQEKVESLQTTEALEKQMEKDFAVYRESKRAYEEARKRDFKARYRDK